MPDTGTTWGCGATWSAIRSGRWQTAPAPTNASTTAAPRAPRPPVMTTCRPSSSFMVVLSAGRDARGDGEPGAQRPGHGGLVRDLEQAVALLLGQRCAEAQLALDPLCLAVSDQPERHVHG